ncbi:hypothetical protein C5167_026903 [Papaver somniferum]|nr:hypothetical protein C5167_026903 [Papaver somniferum]
MCSLHHLCELAVKIKALIKNKQLHLKALKSCPFWRFFEPFYDGVMNKDELIKKTKAVIMFLSTIENRPDGKLPYCFKLARSRKMTLRTIPEHFAVTFGFQMVNYVEADDIDEDLVKKVNVFVFNYFAGNKKTKKTDIEKRMLEAANDETRADDFVKFFVMFLLVSVFVPNKCGQTLAAKYLYMVFDMNKVCWPEVFHDYVLDSIMTNRTDVENVVGCVIYPLYWLAEMTKIAQRKHGLDKYLRFARWSLSNICQQVLSNFENLEEKTELWSKENIGHRKGSFLLQYDESEMRLDDPVDEVEIVVPDEENEVPVITRDVNMINQQESEQEQVISSSSKTVTDDEQEGDGTELTPNNIEDIKVAERVEYEMENATSSKPVTEEEQEGDDTELNPNTIEDIKVAEQVESEMSKASSSMPVTNDEQEGEGTELTPNNVEDIKVAERVESEMSKASSSKQIIEQEENETQFVIDEDVTRKMEYEYNKKGCSSSKPNVGSVYYYPAVKMANDLLELENEQPGFDLGLSQCDSQEKGQGELSVVQRMSNMVTRMREDRRNLVPPIRMQDYNTSVKKRRKDTTRKCKENKEVQEVQGVKLKPVDNLKILKVLNRNEKPLVTTFFRKNNERSTAWEHLNLQLHISGKMMDNLMREGDVAGDIIEFYILKLQNNMKKMI